MPTCPLCHHTRTARDALPDWKCPDCGVPYSQSARRVELGVVLAPPAPNRPTGTRALIASNSCKAPDIMEDPNQYHQRELLELRPAQPQSREELHRFLLSLGFTAEDDYYFLDRGSRIPLWQSQSLLSIDVLANGEPIHETEDDIVANEATDWHALQVSYLLATLPPNCIEPALELVASIAAHFRLAVFYRGEHADLSLVREQFRGYASSLTRNYDEPGSEGIRILIEMDHNSRS